MTALMERVLADKRRRHRELAALPFPEKVKIVELMREAPTALRASKFGHGRHRE